MEKKNKWVKLRNEIDRILYESYVRQTQEIQKVIIEVLESLLLKKK